MSADLAVPALLYNGRQMNPEPRNPPGLGLALDLKSVARLLQLDAYPLIVELEPGDGTYYNLLIVPAWSEFTTTHLGRYGIPPDKTRDFLIVTKLSDGESQTFFAADDVGEWDLHGIENNWSRELIVWWLRFLWQHITKLRAVGPF